MSAIFAVLALFFGGIFFLYALKYYMSIALVLIANGSNGNGNGNGDANGHSNGASGNGLRGIKPNDGDHGQLRYKPFISVHLPVYNESTVVDRLLKSVTSFDYENFEVIVADDSSDETSDILDRRWANHPKVKISRRDGRSGFKGGALQKALEITDPRAEFIVIFDADFIPPPDILQQFLSYFYGANGNANGHGDDEHERPSLVDDRLAVVQGYQWHVLNASENWITRGIRTEFAGSYVVERSSQQLLGSMKMISGSVFMIRSDVLRQHGWGTSITEDWDLTIRIYLSGYKVLYTPFIQAPSEIVATFRQLTRQRMRWAEGHTFNVKKYFMQVLNSPNLEKIEKLEWIYFAPYYLQSVFFILGTTFWFLSEFVFQYRLPMLPAAIGWALVFTNALSLVFMNLTGLFMERGIRRNWRGLLSFILLTFLLVPYQAYASLKGLLEQDEGGWHRTQKTGVITDVVDKLGLGKRMKKLLPRQKKSKKKKKKDQSGLDIGRRLGGAPVAQVIRRIPEPVRKRVLGLSPGMRLASGMVAVLLLIGMAVVVLSDAQFAPNLAAAAIFVPIFASLATERRRMSTRIVSVVISILLALTLLSVQVAPVIAAPDSFYLYDTALIDGRDMDISPGSATASLDFDTIGQTEHWYTSEIYPSGTDEASLTAGSYTLNMVFGALPISAGSVDITVGMYHTRPDGSDARLITSATTTIDSGTVGPLALDLGAGAAESFTQSDPRRLRVTIDIDGIVLGESFTLNFNSVVDETRLETPSITVLDPAIVLAFVAVFIPMVTLMVTQRRKLASRVVSLALALIIALALLSSQVQVVTAAPDAFYLHANVLNDGEDMSTTTGVGPTSSTTFDTLGQTERWYTTLTYPVGGGDDSTLDAGNYTFNMYFQQLPGGGWWNTNYGFRRQITVNTGSQAVLAGHTAPLSFDHFSLVAAGKAHSSGDDVRVIHYDGITYTELDRVQDPYTLWNDASDDTKIWFSLVDPISASSSDNQYWLYFGYPLAPLPPTAMEMVFLVGDDFNDGTLTPELTASTIGGSIYESFGEAVIDAGNAAIDSAILVSEEAYSGGNFAIRNLVNLEDGTGEAVLFGLAEEDPSPSPALGVTDAATEAARRRIAITHDATSELVYITYVDTSDTTWYWNSTSWVNSLTSYTSWGLDEYHAIEFYSDGPDWWFELKDTSGNLLVGGKTGDVSWSSTKDDGDDFWYYWGEPVTDQEWIDFVFSDWLDIRDYVNPEPTTVLGLQQTPPSVDIDVFVYHTRADGTDPILIINNSTTIDPNTANPFIFDLGNTVSATSFSSSDPRRLLVQVTVDDININTGGDFILDYDSPTELSRLETPSLTVLDPALLLAIAAIFIPIITALLTERRRMAARLISVIVSLMLALALLSTQVGIVSAAPGSIYLYDTSKVGPTPAGETMDATTGSSAASLTFDTASQSAYWYTDLSYPTGGDDASIVAGDYLFEMYFDSLPSTVGWWDAAYGFKQQITVAAGSAAVPSGYSTLLTFDHAALVTAGKALSSGDDLRVVFWNGASFVELDRALDDSSSWDNASTSLWIQTQASIAASSTDTNYYIYYGNSGATGPPANKSNIFLFWDDFESETIGSVPSAWTEKDPSFDWSVQVDPTDGTNQILRARNVNDNYVYTTNNLGAYDTEVQVRILGQSVNPSVALAHRYDGGAEPQSYHARQRQVPADLHIWKRSGNCSLGSSAFTLPADTWVIQRARATDSGSDVVLDYRAWDEATPSTFAQVNATDLGSAPGCANPVNQAFERIGIYASESLEDLHFDDVRVRLYVSPEPTAPFGSEEFLPSVDITVSVHHTKTDGTIPQLITSTTTTIDPNTVDGLALNLGSGVAQTYTQADPQLLRIHITVDAINNGGSFVLAYDSAADPTNLETPILTVLDPVLLLAFFAVLIPFLVSAIWRKRRLAGSIVSALIGAIVAISLLASQVVPTTAAPDVFYLHVDPATGSGGLDVGSGVDGSATISSSTNLNTTIIGTSRSGNPDGIATAVSADPTGTSISVGSSSGFAAGDDLILINLQGTSSDNADVGKYEVLEVQSVPDGTTIDVATSIQNSYDGTSFGNQIVIVQRIPQWTSVTVNSGGTLTASSWNGSTGGIVAFKASGTVTVSGGGSIDVSTLGYSGGAGGSNDGGPNGESYDGAVGKGGEDTVNGSGGGSAGTDGGGGSSNYATNSPAGTRGGGGGGGNTDAGSSGDGAGGAGGGGYGGGGGGGGGGGDGSPTAGGTGGLGGDSGVDAGGGGMGGDNDPAGGVGGDAPSDGGVTGSETGPALGGSGSTTGEGGRSPGATSGGIGAGGGGGGGLYGTAALSQLYLGSGGGGGGSHDDPTMVPGQAGGDGGGIIYIIANSVTVTGNVISNGAASVGPGSREGAGGGGAGGSILIEANSATLGASLVTATGGARSAGGSIGGGGGAGGVGRIHISSDTITGTTGPVADTSGTPGGGGSLTPAGETMDLIEGVGGGLDTGSGIDGSVTLAASANINTDIIGTSRSGSADGVSTNVTANPTGTSISVGSITGFAAGDDILLINMQGSSGDTADVGNYEILEVSTVGGSTINVTSTIQNSYDGTTFANQVVRVQRIPLWTSVTINSGGSLTADAWNGSSGGIIVFKASGSVAVNGTGSIDAIGIGYQGGAGGATDGGANGESYDGQNGKGGADTLAGTLGGGSGQNHSAQDNTTGTRGGGGGGGETGSIGEGGAGGAGGGYGGGGGGGGGGSDSSTYISGAGGAGGTTGDSAGGGGHGEDSGTSGDGGAAGSPGNDGGVSVAVGGGLAGSGTTTGQGGHSENNGDSPGGGGGGGGNYGLADLSQIFFGSSGGGGGDSGDTSDPGSGETGGDGGGIIFIIADTVDNNATIQLQGANGIDATDGDGASGGGSGGVGRIRIEADTILGTTSPAASTAGTPGGGSPTKTFNSVGSTYWYHDVAWPTGSDDATMAAGDYTFNMYFSSLPAGSGSWYDTDWLYRKQITVQSSQVDANVSNFPVYMDLADLGTDFFSNVNGDGGDIRFTNSDGVTEMAREVVAIDTGAETGELHFRADSLSSSANTSFYIYYGNSGASDYAVTATYGRNNVWSNSYAAVYHLEEEAAGITSDGLYVDSTGNGNEGDDRVSATGQLGQLGAGQQLDGSDDFINMGDIHDFADPAGFVLESWIRPVIPGPEVSGTSSTTDFDAVPSVTFQHTVPSGSNRLLIVAVSFDNDGLETVTGVTYNGDAMTSVGIHANSDDAYVEIWSKVAPEVGTNMDIVVTFSTDPLPILQGGTVGATNFINAEQSDPNPVDFVGADATTGPATVNATSASGELVFAVVGCETCDGLTPIDEVAEVWTDVSLPSPTFYGAAGMRGGTSTTTMEWALDSNDHWSIGAVPIRPAAGVGLSDQMTFIGKWGGTGSDRNYRFEVETDNSLTFLPGGGVDPLLNSTTLMGIDTWHHAAVNVRQSTDTIRLFLDGTEEDVNSSWTGAIGDGTYDFNLGRRPDVSQLFDGYMDEVRITNTYRSAGWIETGYNNQNSTTSFYTVAGQEANQTVDITVYVHHTSTDGSGATLITSATTTIDGNTADPLVFDVGNDPIGQTFTSADPRFLRVQVEVTAANNGGSFVLDYDGPCASDACSSLDTPVVVVPEFGLIFGAFAVLIPVAMGSIWRRRRNQKRAFAGRADEARKAHDPLAHSHGPAQSLADAVDQGGSR